LLTLPLAASLEQGFATAATGGQCAGEAEPVQGGAMTAGGFEHDAAHQPA